MISTSPATPNVPQNVVRVSSVKPSPKVYRNDIINALQKNEYVDVSGIGSACVVVVNTVDYFKQKGLIEVAQIRTAFSDNTEDPKAQFTVKIQKSDGFDKVLEGLNAEKEERQNIKNEIRKQRTAFQEALKAKAK